MNLHSKQNLKSKAPSQRQMMIATEIKCAIANMFVTDVLSQYVGLSTSSFNITDAKISTDLKLATLYLLPRDDINIGKIILLLNTDIITRKLKSLLKNRVRLRYLPDLRFKLDTVLEKSTKVQEIIRLIELANKPTTQIVIKDET